MFKKSICFLLFLLFFIPSVSFARDLQVGVSPNRIDMGEIAPGSESYTSFSLVTQSREEILVRLGALYADRGVFDKPENLRFRNISSDQDASGWVKFPANPVVIIPANESMKTLGGSINGWRDAGLSVRVPENAEPCYYSFQVKPTPYIAAAYDTGVNIAAVTVVTVFFKVPGNCVRAGAILDIQQAESTGREIAIDTYFKNTGNATVFAEVADIKAFYENGTEAASSQSGPLLVRPGATVALRSIFPQGALSQGRTFRIESTVSYGSGSDTKSVMISIEEPKAAAEAVAFESKGKFGAYLPAILAILLIIAILYVSYKLYKKE